MNFRALTGLKQAAVLGAMAVFSITGAAQAATVNLTDNYDGGYDTWPVGPAAGSITQGGVTSNLYENDVIGDTSAFNIFGASVTRTNGGNTLVVTINTDYAGMPGTAAADGTGYGALFITPGTWKPSGTAANDYATDTYATGEKWAYAFTVPMDPSTTSGSGGLYATTDGQIQLSNVYGNQTTYPFPNNPNYYFREGQAVQFTPAVGKAPIDTGTWTVGTDTLTFTVNDGGKLGDYFAMAWAMTCGNDVFQTQVSGVPEPGTWAMMLLGFGLIGFAARRKKTPGSLEMNPI